MLALIRKDLSWVLPLFVASVLTFFFVVISNDVNGTWVSLDQPKWAVLHLLLAVAAILVGATLALRDPICGTRELLRHRSVSPRQLYRAQVLLGAIFVVALTAAWLAIDGTRLSIHGLWSIALVDLSPFAFLLSGSILALACFAITLISLQLPIPWLGRVFALAVLLLAVAVIHSLSTGGWMRDGYTASMSMHLVLMAALTLALLWLGARSTSLERDPDRPLSSAGLRTVLWLVVPLFLPLVTLGVSILQEGARDPLTSIRPIVVQTEEHGFTLARRQGRQGYTLLDADRRVLATGVQREDLLSRSWPSQAWVSAPELFDYRLATDRRTTRVWQRDAWGQWTLLLSARSGELIATARSWAATPAPDATRQRRPDGAAFSTQAFFFEVSIEREGAHFVVDPVDRSVWQLRFTPKQLVAPQLLRVPLPGSDPIRGKGLARASGMEKWKTALLGEDSGYIWDGTQWSIADRVDRRRDLPEPASDALAPVITVARQEGESSPRQWTMSPQGPMEWAAAGLFISPELLRPLPSALWAILAPDHGRRRHWSQGLLLSDYAWLILVPLLGTGLTILILRRRLRRIGAPATRIRPWLICSAILGPAALLLFFPIETRRAHRQLPLGTGSRLRIQALDASSAASA